MPIHWNTPKDAWQDLVQHVAERTVEESWHLADYYHGAPTSERDRIEAWGLQEMKQHPEWGIGKPNRVWGKTADAMTTFNPVAPIDELTGFLDQNGGSAIGLLNPNNPLSEDADPNANTANPNMNPANPNAFANPANPALNAALPTAQTNPANPQFNPSVPGAQNNPSNPMYNPSVPGSTNNSANPELNPNYPGSMTNPSNPIHNPDWPNPEGVPQRPMQARTWEPKQSWTFEPEVGYEVPDVGDELAGSVVSEMDNLSVHLEDGRGMAADQAQALRDACLRLASALEPAVDNDGMTKRAWNPFKYTPEPAQSPQEAAQGRMCYFHPDRPAVAAEGFAAMCPECYERYQSAQRGEQYQEPQVERVAPTNSEWQGLYNQARGWEPREAADIPGSEMSDSHDWPYTVKDGSTSDQAMGRDSGRILPRSDRTWSREGDTRDGSSVVLTGRTRQADRMARGEGVSDQEGVSRVFGSPGSDEGVHSDASAGVDLSSWHPGWRDAGSPHQREQDGQQDQQSGVVRSARTQDSASRSGLRSGASRSGEGQVQAGSGRGVWDRILDGQEDLQHVGADIPGFEIGDSHQHADPTEPRSSEPPAPPLCTCAEGQKLECPVHGLHATDPENDDLWGRWHLPEGSPVGFPAQTGQPRGWQAPYVNS